MQKRTRRLINLLIPAGIFLAAAIISLGFWLGWFSRSTTRISIGLPGSAVDKTLDFKLDPTKAQALEERMLELLQSDGPSGLTSWHQLAGRLGQPPAVRSEEFWAADQLRYGQYLLEQGNEKNFQAWWLKFRASYLTDQGVIRVQPAGQNEIKSNSDDFWRDNLSALRLLAQSCSLWPARQRQADLTRLSGQLILQGQQGLSNDFSAAVPTLAPTPDPAATPTPKPPTPTAGVPTGQNLDVLRLSTLDLYTMQQLAQLDSHWQTLYERYAPIVQAGYISEILPLYALGYSEKPQGYLPFTGNFPAVDTEAALMTVLHLCEVGQENPRSLSWIKEQLYNQHALYKSYHITQGSPASQEESLPAYAIVARIARIKNDAALYLAAVDRLLWHQATSQTSKARSCIFRQNESGLIFVHALDNTWALISIH